MGGMDNCELEEAAMGFESLCVPAEVDFQCGGTTIEAQLRRIAEARGNRPVSPEEQKKLHVALRFLPLIQAADK